MRCVLVLLLVLGGIVTMGRLQAEEPVAEPEVKPATEPEVKPVAEPEAKPAAEETAKPVAAPVVAPEVVKPITLGDLVRDGDMSVSSLPLAGFGPMGVLGASFEIQPPAPYVWKDEDGRKTLKLDSYTATFWQVPGDWSAVRKLLPVTGEKDEVTSRKLYWNGVSAWRIDYTLAKTPADGSGARQRYLVAPMGAGFIVLGFKGEPDKFAAERPQMQQVALGFSFVVNGLIGEYFDGRDLGPDKLQRVQVDPVIDFPWGGGGPGEGVGPDNFSVRWTGRLRAPATATYTMITVTDDGVRLWLDEKPIIDNWTDHGNTEDKLKVDLQEGKEYSIRLEWYEAYGGAVVQLFWEAPELERAIIPATVMLSRPEPGFRDVPKPMPKEGDLEGPAGMPALLYGQTPGSYHSSPANGLKWTGQKPKQTMTLGTGEKGILVTLQQDRVSSDQIRSLLPNDPKDQVDISAVLLKEVPAWRADCTLANGSFLRVYLFPLKQGAAVSLRLESASSKWSQSQKDSIVALLDSITFSPNVEDRKTGIAAPDPLF